MNTRPCQRILNLLPRLDRPEHECRFARRREVDLTALPIRRALPIALTPVALAPVASPSLPQAAEVPACSVSQR